MLGAIKLMNLRDEERSNESEMSRAGRTTAEVVGAASMSGAYRGLAAAAGMTLDELMEHAEAGRLDAALRSAAEKAVLRRNPRRYQIEILQRRAGRNFSVRSCRSIRRRPVPPPRGRQAHRTRAGHRALTSTAQYPPGPIANPMGKNRWARILITADSRVVFWALSIPILSAVLV
jgi:hypothetical protein